jgi:hypothetical protein
MSSGGVSSPLLLIAPKKYERVRLNNVDPPGDFFLRYLWLDPARWF